MRVPAAEALHVVPVAELMTAARALARQIADRHNMIRDMDAGFRSLSAAGKRFVRPLRASLLDSACDCP